MNKRRKSKPMVTLVLALLALLALSGIASASGPANGTPAAIMPKRPVIWGCRLSAWAFCILRVTFGSTSPRMAGRKRFMIRLT